MIGYVRRVAALDDEYRAAVAALRQSSEFTAEGLEKQIEQARARRDQAIARVQEQAAAYLQQRRNGVAKDIKAARLREAYERRKLLGDVVTVELLRQEIGVMSPTEVVDAVEGAPDVWHRTVLTSLAHTALRAQNPANVDTVQAWARLSTLTRDPHLAESEKVLREVQVDESLLERLDPDAYRQDLSDSFHVDADAVSLSDIPLVE
jgi:hypothetical protein